MVFMLYHPLHCCIYTVLVSLIFGTVIPISFTFNEMFTDFSLYVVTSYKFIMRVSVAHIDILLTQA